MFTLRRLMRDPDRELYAILAEAENIPDAPERFGYDRDAGPLMTSGLHTVGQLTLQFFGDAHRSVEVFLVLKVEVTAQERERILEKAGELIVGFGKGDTQYKPEFRPAVIFSDRFVRE